jgi:hypothetical protein
MAQLLKPVCLSTFPAPFSNVDRLMVDAALPARLANRENAHVWNQRVQTVKAPVCTPPIRPGRPVTGFNQELKRWWNPRFRPRNMENSASGPKCGAKDDNSVISPGETLCDAPCYNTNKFAPNAYYVRCDECGGRRGYVDRDDQWIECTKCMGTGSVCCPRCRGTGKLIQNV